MTAVNSLLIVSLICLSASISQAAVIAQYTFDGNNYEADPSNPAGANTGLDLTNKAFPLVGVTASEIKFSPGIDPSMALGFAADHYDGALGFSTDGNSDRSFITTDQAIFFTVSLAPGVTVDLTSLNFDSLKTRGGNDSSRSSVTHAIFVNPPIDPAINGLAGRFDFLAAKSHEHLQPGQGNAESTGDAFTTGRWEAGPVNLTQFQGLTGVNTFAIRMNSNEALDRDFGIDNIVLMGNVTTVPEPNALAALLAITAGTTCYRRRPRD